MLILEKVSRMPQDSEILPGHLFCLAKAGKEEQKKGQIITRKSYQGSGWGQSRHRKGHGRRQLTLGWGDPRGWLTGSPVVLTLSADQSSRMGAAGGHKWPPIRLSLMLGLGPLHLESLGKVKEWIQYSQVSCFPLDNSREQGQCQHYGPNSEGPHPWFNSQLLLSWNS